MVFAASRTSRLQPLEDLKRTLTMVTMTLQQQQTTSDRWEINPQSERLVKRCVRNRSRWSSSISAFPFQVLVVSSPQGTLF